MSLPYDRKFNAGRQSEQLYNEELHKMYESMRHLLDIPEGKKTTPTAKLDGSLWLDRAKNELKSFDKSTYTWRPIFDNKFKIVDEITSQLPPENPVLGQLWIYADVLMYYNGSKWTPVKALEQDGSQFNLSIFENFSLASPLWRIGNTIVEDEDVKEFQEQRRKYLQDKLDFKNDDEFITGKQWVQGDEKDLKGDKPKMPELPGGKSGDKKNLSQLMETKCQFLVPNIDLDRVFLDGKINFDYERAPHSKVCITYKKRIVADHTPSLIHVNPGRLTDMRKRLIKVDRVTPKIGISADNTEFYGFNRDSVYGELLLPEAEKDDGGYIVLKDGIYLSHRQCQNYDYVLAVTYTFSWYRSTGKMECAKADDQTNSFYVANYAGPLTVFADGYNLESPEYTEDDLSQVVTVNNEGQDIEDYSFMHSLKGEYGYIRSTDIYGRGVVKTLKEYKKPLLFMNGQAMDPKTTDMEVDGNYIYVKGAQINMPWTVIELYDTKHDYDMSMGAKGDGIVIDNDATGHPVICYDKSKIDDDDDIILFVDGLLVKKEDIIRQNIFVQFGPHNTKKQSGTVTTEGLKKGQHYILLRDKYHCLYNEKSLTPALPVGHISDSLVYVNGYLICNNTCVNTILSEKDAKKTAANGEIKFFYRDAQNPTKGVFALYDSAKDQWIYLDQDESEVVHKITDSYANTVNAVAFHINIELNDDTRVYGFNFAQSIEHPLIVRNLPIDGIAPEGRFVQNQKDFLIRESYVPEIGALSVYVNGVRQYNVIEHMDGQGFSLPEPVTGIVTYVIEMPERGQVHVAEREILDETKAIPGTINAYSTKISLYPGRVIFYVNGIRQPQQAFTILDNHTILVNDNKNMLVGCNNNFPDEPVRIDDKGNKICIHHEKSDQILVEVKHDYDRQESFAMLSDTTNQSIDIRHYNLPIGILEPADEIMIYIDGIYTGLRKAVDENMQAFAYAVNRYSGNLTIKDVDWINRITNDPLYTFYESHPEAKLAYQNTHGGDSYQKRCHSILLDWR